MKHRILPLGHQETHSSCSCSVTQSCLTLCNPMDCSTPGFPVLYHFPELAQIHIYRVSDAIQPSLVIPFSSCLQPFPTSGSFPVSQLFTSGDQSTGASASASVLPMNQFSSAAQSCLTLWDPMDLRVHHQLPEFTQTHVH